MLLNIFFSINFCHCIFAQFPSYFCGLRDILTFANHHVQEIVF